MANTDTTYAQALAELEKILTQLRAENCDVDTLAERTRRAAELLRDCRSRLTRTEDELSQILAELEQATFLTPHSSFLIPHSSFLIPH